MPPVPLEDVFAPAPLLLPVGPDPPLPVPLAFGSSVTELPHAAAKTRAATSAGTAKLMFEVFTEPRPKQTACHGWNVAILRGCDDGRCVSLGRVGTGDRARGLPGSSARAALLLDELDF